MNIPNAIKNLKSVRAVLERTPAQEVNLDMWTDKTACGTLHCIGGHFCSSSEGQELGLILDKIHCPFHVSSEQVDFRALETALGITAEMTFDIFTAGIYEEENTGPGMDIDHKTVGIARIDKAIKQLEAEYELR